MIKETKDWISRKIESDHHQDGFVATGRRYGGFESWYVSPFF